MILWSTKYLQCIKSTKTRNPEKKNEYEQEHKNWKGKKRDEKEEQTSIPDRLNRFRDPAFYIQDIIFGSRLERRHELN